MRLSAITPEQTFELQSPKAYDEKDRTTVTVRMISSSEAREFSSKFGKITTEATRDGIRAFVNVNPIEKMLYTMYIGISDLEILDDDGNNVLSFKDGKIDMSFDEFSEAISPLMATPQIIDEIIARIVEVNPLLS